MRALHQLREYHPLHPLLLPPPLLPRPLCGQRVRPTAQHLLPLPPLLAMVLALPRLPLLLVLLLQRLPPLPLLPPRRCLQRT